MKMRRLLPVILITGYILLIIPFTKEMKARPVAVKLGYFPEPEAVKLVVGDQKYLASQYAVLKVIMYFGALVDQRKQQHVTPEYENMFATLKTASVLDPWNADIYYFAQAAFVWELQKTRDVNVLLDYGMKYRTWDDQLPFFAGFNASFFLKDYAAAAQYLKRSADISKNPLVANLTARYFYESGQEELGIRFVDYMQQRTADVRINRIYLLRKEALQAVLKIKRAVSVYNEKFGVPPQSVDTLVSVHLLDAIPADPYGGTFYLDSNGMVRTSSKFSMSGIASPFANQNQ